MTLEVPKIKISAIIANEKVLEVLVNELIEIAVDRHQISIQGTPEQLHKIYGERYMNPDVLQHSHKTPKKEPFLIDDFGWVLAFSFSIPMFIGLIIGVFVIGDLFSVKDNFLYGALGGAMGSIIGFFIYKIIKRRRDKKHLKQEIKGGFVIWIQVETDAQEQEIIAILQKYQAEQIEKKY